MYYQTMIQYTADSEQAAYELLRRGITLHQTDSSLQLLAANDAGSHEAKRFARRHSQAMLRAGIEYLMQEYAEPKQKEPRAPDGKGGSRKLKKGSVLDTLESQQP